VTTDVLLNSEFAKGKLGKKDENPFAFKPPE